MLLVLLGCDPIGPWSLDSATTAIEARVALSPARLEFGTVSVLEDGDGTLEFTVFNLGEDPVTLTGQDEVVGDTADAAVFVIDAQPVVTIPGGGETSFPVHFRPDTEGSWLARVDVAPSGETLALVAAASAPVAGFGEVEVPAVVLGCTGTGSVAVENAGSEVLHIQSMAFEGDELALGLWPDTIEPGGEVLVPLSFTPAGAGERGAALTLWSDDPLAPERAMSVTGLGYEGERVEERFRYTPSNPTDMLFVADAGEDTRAAFDQLPRAVETFIDTLRNDNIDYQVAAIAADPCPDGAPGWATRSDTSLAAEALIEREISDVDSAWDGALLDLAVAAITQADGGCLTGFRREGADLHVILVGDGPAIADPRPLLAALEARVGAHHLRVSAFVPLDGECGSPAVPYVEAAALTGGVLADFCGDDWEGAFAEFATLPAGASPVMFPLAEAPVPSTLEVLVEGSTWTAWSYEEASQSVVFSGEPPALGAEVVIRYVLAVACG